MAIDTADARELMRRLLLSRMRILNDHPFFGLLLMHMRYGVDESTPTAYTDGERIVFGVDFLMSLSEHELDFIMMHEIMHVVLQHCMRGSQYEDADRFNIACDIVVNSNILLENNMDLNSISLRREGPSMHSAPDGKEGYEYTAEQVYQMLPTSPSFMIPAGNNNASNGTSSSGDGEKSVSANGNSATIHKGGQDADDSGGNDIGSNNNWNNGRSTRRRESSTYDSTGFSDDHSHWCKIEDDSTLRDAWAKNIRDAGKAIEIRESVLSRGLLPAFAKRLLKELRRPQTDWRQILEEFIQREINDYSFSPPDRRMEDSPFFLPDFNETEDAAQDILFMIDTSGSISDEMMTAAYSEVKGAIDQFDNALEGWLGFFDAAIIEPVRFASIDEFIRIEPAGGGGTDFQIIFEYVAEHMENNLPACIIILTDGYAPFPQEQLTMGIPVLWLINNEVVNPPWGKVARIQV